LSAAAGKQFQVKGWEQVPQTACTQDAHFKEIGTFPRPWVLWHARNTQAQHWVTKDGKGVDACVNLNSGFSYTWDGNARQCQAGETAVPFFLLEVKPNAPVAGIVLE
jgi:hypothetical protein